MLHSTMLMQSNACLIVTRQRNMEYQQRNTEAQITTMREATAAQINTLTEVVPSLVMCQKSVLLETSQPPDQAFLTIF